MSDFLLAAQPSAQGTNWVPILIGIGAFAAVATFLFLAVKTILGVGKWVERVDSFKEAIDSLQKSFDSFVSEVRRALPKITVSGESPLRLTDLGRLISEQIEAEVWAGTLVDELALFIVDMTAEFEVHEFAREYVEGAAFELSPDFQRRIDACAYQNGITPEQVKGVLVVVLRDNLLASMPDQLESGE